MLKLVAGLVIFLGVHSIRIFAPGWRDGMIARLGATGWKALYSIASLAGFVLVIGGYAAARLEPVVLYNPPFLAAPRDDAADAAGVPAAGGGLPPRPHQGGREAPDAHGDQGARCVRSRACCARSPTDCVRWPGPPSPPSARATLRSRANTATRSRQTAQADAGVPGLQLARQSVTR